ncbi:hypothetical protein Tco_0389802 [Tanacetum coccineum]
MKPLDSQLTSNTVHANDAPTVIQAPAVTSTRPDTMLDEKWFNLHKDILRDALDITPSNDNNPFVAPPSSDIVIEYNVQERGRRSKRRSSDATKVTKPKAAKVTKPTSDKALKPIATQPPKPKPTPTQPSKAISEKKQKLVKETPDEPSPAK